MHAMDGERGLLEQAARQHGLVTLDDVRRAGLSDDIVHRRLRHGRWSLQRRGVYRVNGAPATEAQAVMAACLVAGPAAVASHLTAARLWRLRLPDPELIELTTPPGRRVRAEGVRQHRTPFLARDEVHRVQGIRSRRWLGPSSTAAVGCGDGSSAGSSTTRCADVSCGCRTSPGATPGSLPVAAAGPRRWRGC